MKNKKPKSTTSCTTCAAQANNEKKNCNYQSVELSYEKNSKKEIVELDKFKSRGYEIIGGYKTGIVKINAKVSGQVGPCSVHTKKIFDSKSKFISKSNTECSLLAPSSDFTFGFLSNDFSESKVFDYSINVNSCGQGLYLLPIYVYPDTEVTANFGIGFEKSKHRDEVERKWSTGKTLEYKKDGNSSKYDLMKIESLVNGFQEAVKIVDGCLDLANKIIGPVTKFTVLWPNFNLEYNKKFDDAKNEYFDNFYVYIKQTVKLGLTPLIGFTWEVDLISLVLSALPGGCALIRLKANIEDFIEEVNRKSKRIGVTAEVKFEGKFVLKGEVNGNLNFISTQKPGQQANIKKLSTNGLKAEGAIKGTFTIDAHAQFESVVVAFGLGLKSELAGGFGVELEFAVNHSSQTTINLKCGTEELKVIVKGYSTLSGPRFKQDSKAKNTQGAEIKNETSMETLSRTGEKVIYESVWIEKHEFINKTFKLN